MSAFVPRIGILLSTFNGARYLAAQLESFRAQTEPHWVLYWRDDGSSDETVAIMTAFAAELGPARSRHIEDGEHLGASGSFFALLQAAAPDGLPVAFADQDDVWLPEKLAWGLEALTGVPGPVLYCTRQTLVDVALAPIAVSARVQRPPCFAAALTQNIATGCTTILDPAAVRLVAGSVPPPATLHDWWSYLVVAAAGGRIIADDRPTVLYRQHGANLVGAPPSTVQRARAALQRGPGVYMAVLRQHVAALLAQRSLLTDESYELLATIDQAIHGRVGARLKALLLPGFRRQTPAETAVFRCWFIFG